jgi:hypothetical protein
VERSIHTESCDHHDERMNQIGTVRKATEREEPPE